MAELQAKHGHLSGPQRWARIEELREANYLRRIEEIEAIHGSTNVHGLEKHGAQTSLMNQLRRVSQRIYPNRTTGLQGNATKKASKFLSHRDHYETLIYALRQPINPSGLDIVRVPFDRSIGIGINNLGTLHIEVHSK